MISRNIFAVAAAALVLVGCSKKAEGQVAAIVNGGEITVAEVNAELAIQPPLPGMSESQARQAALKRVIDRRLLSKVAKDEGLDKTPDFLIRQRALADALLVQTLAKKIESTVRIPDTRDIDAFIKERPETFASRSVLSIDQLQFTPAGDPTLLKRLEGEQSLDAIAAILRDKKIVFARASTQIDTARLPPAVAKQILALPAGEPFIVPQDGVYVAGVVTGTRAAPIEAEKARPAAVGILRGEQIDKVVRQRLDAAKQSAKIEYQQGYAPAADASKPSPDP